MFFTLELVPIKVCPIHAHEFIVARNNNIFWNFGKLFNIVNRVRYLEQLSHFRAVNLSGQILVEVVLESKCESIKRLILSVHIGDNVRDDWNKGSNSNKFGWACCAVDGS